MKEDIVHMPAGLFAMDPEKIADSLASKEVSPTGPATGMRVLTFYLTRSSRQLSPSRRKRLEKARKLLSVHVEKAVKEEERREEERREVGRRRVA
ncbi:MAG TPA: DUF3175 domain-containing protein [Terracidiphilus sp.]|nr:DUF3175 domain-containing protein [Terracidiphilus sp.]